VKLNCSNEKEVYVLEIIAGCGQFDEIAIQFGGKHGRKKGLIASTMGIPFMFGTILVSLLAG